MMVFCRKLPLDMDFANTLLIFDRRLQRRHSAWIACFRLRYGVASGEQLKDIRELPRHLKKILKITENVSPQKLSIVALGGGSVGDFSGFVASVLKRGVRLIHIPSTWLSAMDSAHGGKTALNVGEFKNQIGTFYPAHKTYLVRSLLMSQPAIRCEEVYGEVLKMALINGGSLYKNMIAKKPTENFRLWQLLPLLISAKMKIVRQDPLEKKGLRAILNLGHTVGHVLEGKLAMTHGTAVLYGLRFSLQWSQKRGLWRQDLDNLNLPTERELKKQLRRVRNVTESLKQDKKNLGAGRVRFIFIKSPGRAVAAPVSLHELLKEWKRQAR